MKKSIKYILLSLAAIFMSSLALHWDYFVDGFQGNYEGASKEAANQQKDLD